MLTKIHWWWMQVKCFLWARYCWHCDKCKYMVQDVKLEELKIVVAAHLDGHRFKQVGGSRGSTWLNGTDILVNPDAEPEERIVLRQIGWWGFSGRFYTMDEHPSKTETGGYSPIFRFRGD